MARSVAGARPRRLLDQLGGLTWPLNLTGQPALSLPGAFSKQGLLIGVQIWAARGQDGLVLEARHLLERLLAMAVARKMSKQLGVIVGG